MSASEGKGGTVYGGVAPAATQGTVYGGPPAGGTVYNGGNGGTVYGGPAPAEAAPAPTAVQNRPAGGGAAGAKGAGIFFLIAAFTGINVVLMFVGIRFAIGLGATRLVGDSFESMLVVSLVGAGVFALLGIFAKNGNKGAFLIGMLLYGGDLAFLVLNDPALHIISIIIHALFLYYLVNAFRQLD
jgi:hypothetical protein